MFKSFLMTTENKGRNSRHISQSYSKKYLKLKAAKVAIFRYYNTELFCKEYLTAT